MRLYHQWGYKSGRGKLSHIDKFVIDLRHIFLSGSLDSYLVSRRLRQARTAYSVQERRTEASALLLEGVGAW
jgi:hypothetical protein